MWQTHPFISGGINIFQQKLATFVILRNENKNCILSLLTVNEFLKVVLLNIIAILIMPGKLGTPSLLKVTIS